MFFTDKDGTIYRDVDLKGVGYFGSPDDKKASVIELGKKRWTAAGYVLPSESFTGILDEDFAFFDYQMSEAFIKKGIRTTRTIAIIKLEELISNGKKITLKEARNQGFLGKDMTPVIEVRAFATKLRVADLPGQWMETKELIIEDAKKIVSRELGLKETMPDKEYTEWFAETLGRNVALIHKNGWFHDYLTPHNITLDCRIPDLDGVSKLTDGDDRIKDVRNALDAIDELYKSLPISAVHRSSLNYYQKIFDMGYTAVFPPEKREKYFEKIQKKLTKKSKENT